MRNKIVKVISKIGAFLSLLWVVPFLALAQSKTGSTQFDSGLNSFVGLFPRNGIAGSSSITDLIATVIQTLLFVAGAIAVLFIIVGGYWYITSTGNEEQAEKGRSTLINAIIGVVMILMAYVIVTVIANLVGGGVS